MARFKELDEVGRRLLADTINNRMTELGMHQAELKRESGVSELTIRQMQTGVGHGYRESTIAKVSVALFSDGNELLRRLEGNVIRDTPTTGAQAVDELRTDMQAVAGPMMRLLEELFDEVKSLRDEVTQLRGVERRAEPTKAPKVKPVKERRRGRSTNSMMALGFL